VWHLSRALAELGHEVIVLSGPPYPEPMPWAKLVRIPNENFINKFGKDVIPRQNPLSVFKPLNFFELALSRAGNNPEMLAFSLRAFSLLKSWLKKGRKIDIVHDNQSLGYGLLLIQKLGIPVVATVHHPLQVDRKEDIRQIPEFLKQAKRCLYYPLWMQKLVARRMNQLITVSETSRRLISEWYKIPLEKIKTIYNGVDLDVFRPIAEVKKIPGRIIFVGSTEDRKKGILYLLRAVKMLNHKKAHLVIVDGRLRPGRVYAKNLIQTLGLSKKVTWREKISIDELVKEYNQAEVCVVPSLFEGFGLPALEAMACGCALVASSAGALPEVVGEGEDAGGVLVPKGDEKALAEKVNQILSNQEFRKELERKARARAERFFSWRNSARQIEEIYLELKRRALLEDEKRIFQEQEGTINC